jgi:uncharacterized protein involved in exopolysaccharide biosynthesis
MVEIAKKTSEEKVQDFIEKLRPYILKLWNKRKKFLIINGLVLILTVLHLLFLTKPYYESSVVILPEYGNKTNMLSQLGNLAALAGVKVGDGTATEIYQNLLASESVLGPVIYSKYKTKKYQDSVNLIKYFKVESDEKDPVRKNRIDFLYLYETLTKQCILVDVDRLTKILTITAVMPESQLSADVANRTVESLDSYVRIKRKSYATEQLYYLDQRITELKDSLTIAENQLRNFRNQNRLTAQSPDLLLDQARFMRNVEILQAVYIEMTKQHELAKLDEIKDAPVINVKEYAKDPILKTGPKRLLTLVSIFVFSILFSIIYILNIETMKKYITLILAFRSNGTKKRTLDSVQD